MLIMCSKKKEKIGQILWKKGYINQAQLDRALTEQKKHEDRRLGDLLIELGYISQAQLEEGLSVQRV